MCGFISILSIRDWKSWDFFFTVSSYRLKSKTSFRQRKQNPVSVLLIPIDSIYQSKLKSQAPKSLALKNKHLFNAVHSFRKPRDKNGVPSKLVAEIFTHKRYILSDYFAFTCANWKGSLRTNVNIFIICFDFQYYFINPISH